MKCAGATTSAPRYNIYSVTLKAGLEENPLRSPSPCFHPYTLVIPEKVILKNWQTPPEAIHSLQETCSSAPPPLTIKYLL